jgi:hypothetical protein
MSESDVSELWSPKEYAERIQALIDEAFSEERFRVTEVFLPRSVGPLFKRSRRKLKADGRDVTVHDNTKRWMTGRTNFDQLLFDGLKAGKPHRGWRYIIPDGCDYATYVALRERSGLGVLEAREAALLLK